MLFRSGLTDPELEIRCIEPADSLALLNRAAKIDGDFSEPAGYLKTEGNLLIRAQSTCDYNELIYRLFLGDRCLNFADLCGFIAVATTFTVARGGRSRSRAASGK